jgi:hypothetical protein
MQSGSNFLESNKFDEAGNIDLSPRIQKDVFKDSYWFIVNQKKSNLVTSHSNGSRRNIRGVDTPYKRWGHSSMIYNKSLLIFGGRHSHRSLANIYALDLTFHTWNKIEPLGQIPPARDSHSAILVIFKIDNFSIKMKYMYLVDQGLVRNLMISGDSILKTESRQNI